VLVDGEENLGNFGFRVNFKFFLDVIGFCRDMTVPEVEYLTTFGLVEINRVKRKRYLVVLFFLFFNLRVNVKEQFLCRGVNSGSFSL
jgi:hypothetical protein